MYDLKRKQVKRILNLFVPVSACNLHCSYCYVTQCKGRRKEEMPTFKYDPLYIGQALSVERLGGECFVNVCGDGETLLPKEVIQIIYEILKQGHYVECVTNGTLTNRINEMLKFETKLLEHLEFKLSFHYTELYNNNLLETFVDNVKKIKETSSCSFSIELTTDDELIEKIPQILTFCKENFGANCHLTIARNDMTKKIEMLTNLNREEYEKKWGIFDSEMFSFKNKVFGIKRREYCYAGAWMLMVNLATGETSQCYKGFVKQNIFEDIKSDINFVAIGKHCRIPYCYNGHAMLTFGIIPQLDTPFFAEIRNRICTDGSEWLTPELKEFFSSKLVEKNRTYTILEKILNEYKLFLGGIKLFLAKLR